MAQDWIKMREALHEDPAVLQMAALLGTRPEHVVGYCHKFWSWVSRNCHDGSVTGVTTLSLDAVLNLPGFCDMLVTVGWLEYDDADGRPVITIPHFDRHLSEGAKARALAAERQRKSRGKNNADVTNASRCKRDKSVTREEKRREDINTPVVPKGDDAYSEDFECFWSVFPKARKKSKGTAWRAWKKAIRLASAQDIIAAAGEYALSSEGRGEFCKMPSTWLNGRCWQDDRQAWSRSGNTMQANGSTVPSYAAPMPPPRRS